MRPEIVVDPNGRPHSMAGLHRWGPVNCFKQNDLYTFRFGQRRITEIEENFFGHIDRQGRAAVEGFANFDYRPKYSEIFTDLLEYMVVQKLRTPKRLAELARLSGSTSNSEVEKAALLVVLARMRLLFSAIWMECIWQIASATLSPTKFIVSDHPVTVYNQACFPLSAACHDGREPDIRKVGTHTIFPLDLERVLILTNLSWVRNPHQDPGIERPNPRFDREAIFNFTEIQTERFLTETEVNEINFVIKQRAYRYIAAGEKDWLYPEKYIPTENWRQLGGGYLLMPDPRAVTFSGGILIGHGGGRAESYDEYGRRPGQDGFEDEELRNKEWRTFQRFRGEFARLFSPKRRGVAYELGRKVYEDSPNITRRYSLRSNRVRKRGHNDGQSN
jgi:hypothetical protein